MHYKKQVLVLVLFIVIAAIFSSTQVPSETSQTIQAECVEGQRLSCITAEGYTGYRTCENGFYSQQCFIASLDDCTVNRDQLSNVCCKTRDGSIYECNEKTRFSPGEYVIIKVNLQKALQESGLDLDSYKVCAFSKLLATESEVPQHYDPDTAFTTDEVGCSRTFRAADFHQASVDGFIPNTDGKVDLAEVRIYPDTIELVNSQDALENLEISTSVFSFEVNVGA